MLTTWIGLWNDHAPQRFSDVVSTDYVHHAMTGRDLRLDGFRDGFRAVVEAFPDVTYRIDHLLSGGDLAAAYLTATGTHLGPYLGIPASGQVVTFRGMYHCRVLQDRIIEDWDVFDLLTPTLKLGGSIHPPQQ